MGASKSDVRSCSQSSRRWYAVCVLVEAPPSIIVNKAQQPQDARPTHVFGAIQRAGLRGHSFEVTSHQNTPFCLDSPTLGMSSRKHAVNDLQVDQSVESKHAAAADRCVPSSSTACSSERRRQQPGERRKLRSPTSPCTAGSGWMQMAVFERFQRGVAASPGDQRLVTDATRACGSAGPAVGQREARAVP